MFGGVATLGKSAVLFFDVDIEPESVTESGNTVTAKSATSPVARRQQAYPSGPTKR